MKGKATLFVGSLITAIALVAFLAYSIVIVVQARRATPGILADLKSDWPDWHTLEQFPSERVEGLLLVSDPGFYEHSGVDLLTRGAGITTITQGLVKRLFFESFQPGLAKYKQSLIAWSALDRMVDKRTQLELFLNTAYLGTSNGQPVYGFPRAAVMYLGRPVGELSRREFLSLVAMLIAPQTFHVHRRPESNRRRVERIERLLSGEYEPVGLMDVYYGSLEPEEQSTVPAFSYFP